jgi:hypothetical protein
VFFDLHVLTAFAAWASLKVLGIEYFGKGKKGAQKCCNQFPRRWITGVCLARFEADAAG